MLHVHGPAPNSVELEYILDTVEYWTNWKKIDTE